MKKNSQKPLSGWNRNNTTALSDSKFLIVLSSFLPEILVVYTAICIIFILLSTVVPVTDFFGSGNFQSFRDWLRHAGTLLLLVDLALNLYCKSRGGSMCCFKNTPGMSFSKHEQGWNRNVIRSGNRFLLYGICVSALIASFIHSKYGFAANADSILWMFIHAGLFYSAFLYSSKKFLRKTVKITYIIAAVLWCSGSILSLIQYSLLIGKKGPNYASSLLLSGRGFYNHRLYGVFTYPETGSVPGVMLILIGLYFFLTSHKRGVRIFLTAVNIPIFAYIVASETRNASFPFYLCVFTGVFLLARRLYCIQHGTKAKGSLRHSLLYSVIALVFFHLAFVLTQTAVSQLPMHFAPDTQAQTTPVLSTSERADDITESLSPDTQALLSIDLSAPRRLNAAPVSFQHKTKAESGQIYETKTISIRENTSSESDSVQIHRTDLNENLMNDRNKIWMEYLSLYKEIGLFGLSPGNYSKYIQEHHSEMFICTKIKTYLPAAYKRGYIYHPHNGYLMVFVSSGIIGVLFMLAFIFSTVRQVLVKLWKTELLSAEFIFSFLIVMTGAFCAVFDREVFFCLFPTTFIFWPALGILMRESSDASA